MNRLDKIRTKNSMLSASDADDFQWLLDRISSLEAILKATINSLELVGMKVSADAIRKDLEKL